MLLLNLMMMMMIRMMMMMNLIPLLPLESETVLLKSKAWDQTGQGLRPLTVSEP